MLADLARAIDKVFVTAKFCQAHGTTGVELVGADADFGSETKFAAVIETRAGIVHDHGAIDFMLETLCRSAVGDWLKSYCKVSGNLRSCWFYVWSA